MLRQRAGAQRKADGIPARVVISGHICRNITQSRNGNYRHGTEIKVITHRTFGVIGDRMRGVIALRINIFIVTISHFGARSHSTFKPLQAVGDDADPLRVGEI